MRPKNLLISTALVIPALLLPLASCNDGNKNPAEPSTPSITSKPSQASTRVMPKGALASMAVASTAALTTAPPRHNPRSQSGQVVTCFEGESDSPGAGFLGVCQRFTPTNDGAEINTTVQGRSGSYAGVYPNTNHIRGRLITGVVNLNFSYAGGPHQGGVPRLSIPIDEAPTDGAWDHFAFMDAPGCNDGDEFVGRLEGRTDNSCLVNYDGVDYPNWAAFRTAHPGARIARDAITFIIIDQPAHYVIWRVQIN